MLYKHPYVILRREIDHINFQKKYIEEEHFIELYEDKIITAENKFDLKIVFDMSYKMLSDKYGFLYFHTTKGVFTYQIKKDPEELIAQFRKVEIK
ncbi:hypothetical protein J2R98_001976 [Alkalibacillus filiformis]|uniref:Uncharacterized protein n=1 Tax=Alkalibacillus filiformis TaxID=200990 RepID=A0ABU0DUK6_9BACI|nr:hypothetical protein [Alkalibacillus filiformis]MDQ0352142.1 hypothetical protein [Alkalibacillus filiformis]